MRLFFANSRLHWLFLFSLALVVYLHATQVYTGSLISIFTTTSQTDLAGLNCIVKISRSHFKTIVYSVLNFGKTIQILFSMYLDITMMNRHQYNEFFMTRSWEANFIWKIMMLWIINAKDLKKIFWEIKRKIFIEGLSMHFISRNVLDIIKFISQYKL